MQLIKSIVIIGVGKEYLLINTLNGLVDLVSEGVIDILNKWGQDKIISVTNEKEKELYKRLEESGYFCESDDDELMKKASLITRLKATQQKRSGPISSVSFVMTYDCNFACPYCFEKSDKNPRGQYITKDQVDKVLENIGKELKHIGLFGGEPLLPRNRVVIEYIISKAPDKEYSIITNGYYLDEYIDLLKRIKVDFVMVTLDGKREVHDRRRICKNGEKTFDRILNNIEKCLDNSIPIRIRMNVDSDNLNEIESLRNELVSTFEKSRDLLSFEISPMMNDGVFERNNVVFELVKNDMSHIRESEKNVLLSRVSPIVNAIINGKPLRPRYAYCAEEENVWIVDPTGFIYPCLTAVGKTEYAIGRYYPDIELFENSIKCRNIETIEKCRDCKHSFLCGGGCPLKIRPDIDIYSPECGTILNDLYRVIPALWKIKNEA